MNTNNIKAVQTKKLAQIDVANNGFLSVNITPITRFRIDVKKYPPSMAIVTLAQRCFAVDKYFGFAGITIMKRKELNTKKFLIKGIGKIYLMEEIYVVGQKLK